MQFVTAGDCLRLDGVGHPLSVPDVTQDFTVFLQAANLAPAISSNYKNAIALFTGGTEDYSDPCALIEWIQESGQQKILAEVGDGLGGFQDSTYVVTVLDRHDAAWLTYSAATHVMTFYVNGVAQGTMTQDFSATPFTSVLCGGDTEGADGPVAVRYVRFWQKVKADCSAERLSANAVDRVGLIFDTPIEIDIDLSDRADVGGGNWTVVNGGGSNYYPGPLDEGAMAFIVMPESKELFGYDAQGRLTSSMPATHANDRLWNVCPTRDGCVWTNTKDHTTTNSTLRKINLRERTILTTLTLPITVGEQGSFHALMELPSGNLLTVNHTTHALIEIDATDGHVVQTYDLVISPLDGAVNSEGTRLLHTDGDDLKIFDLADNRAKCLVATLDSPVWPVWLPDCTILVVVGTDGYLDDGDVVRLAQNGQERQRYTYDHSTFSEGLYGMAASWSDDRVWLVGDWDGYDVDDLPALPPFTLGTGELLDLVPLVYQADLDLASAVQAVYVPNACNGCISALLPNAPTWSLKGLILGHQILRGQKRGDGE